MDSVLKNISVVDCCAISMNKSKTLESKYFYHTRQESEIYTEEYIFTQLYQDILSLYYCYDLEKKSIKSLL